GCEPGLLGLELLLHVHLHVVAELEARVVGGGGGDRRSNVGHARRVVEGGDAPAIAVPGGQDSVPCALEAAIAKHLDLVPGVDDDGVLDGLDVDPPAVAAVVGDHLEAAEAVVLEEEDEAAGVGVGAEAVDELRPRARRVVAHLGAVEGLEVAVVGEGLPDVPFLQTKKLLHHSQQLLCQLLQLPPVLHHRLPAIVI
ncbi:hypothetical protein EE612_053945, partial [Oryza sativa]